MLRKVETILYEFEQGYRQRNHNMSPWDSRLDAVVSCLNSLQQQVDRLQDEKAQLEQKVRELQED